MLPPRRREEEKRRDERAAEPRDSRKEGMPKRKQPHRIRSIPVCFPGISKIAGSGLQ